MPTPEIYRYDGENPPVQVGGMSGLLPAFEPISLADFLALPVEEQESGSFLVTGMPALMNAYSVNYKDGVTTGQKLDQIDSDLTELGWHKVWENPNPSAAFDQQTVSFSENDFDEYLVLTRSQSVDTLTHNGAVEGGILGWHSPSTGYLGLTLRAFLNVSRTGMTFGVCYAIAPSGSPTVNNALSIPLAVYGRHLSAS